MYIHLHWHSHYSLLEGLGKPADFVAGAKSYGMPALWLTDYNGMYGAIEFYQACKKADIKPILWVELGLVHDRTIKDKGENSWNIVLIAENYTGYSNLLKIVSHANLEWFHGKARMDFDLLREFHAWLFCCVGGDSSYLGQMILRNEPRNKIEETIRLLQQIVGEDRVYLELIAQYENKLKDLKKVNPAIQELGASLWVPLLVSTNYHYVKPDDKEVFEVALSIKDGKQIYDEDRRRVTGDYYLMSEDELKEMMIEKNGYDIALVDEMIANNQALADRTQLEIPMGKILFPSYSSPEDIIALYEQHKTELIEQ